MKNLMRLNYKLLLSICLICLTSSAFAQKHQIAQARELIKKGKELKKAEQDLATLLRDSANRENVKIWDLLFQSLRKQYEVENEKLYLKQKYDTLGLFNIASRMFTAMEAYDSIDAKPDKKGRMKPVFRKDNAELLNAVRPNLFNGGIFMINRAKYANAFHLLDQYIDCANQPLFAAYTYDKNDKLLPQAAYWATYSAYLLNDTTNVLKHIKLAAEDDAHHEILLQCLADVYQRMHKPDLYLSTLVQGFKQYPSNLFFSSHLIQYYSDRDQWEDALHIVNRAISTDSTNTMYQLTKSFILLQQGKFDESFEISNALLQKNDSLAEAHKEAGLAKYNKAVTLEKTANTPKLKKQVLALYREAMPHFEFFRQSNPDRIDIWGEPLYIIYLNLNMGDKFDEINKLLNKQSHRSSGQ